MLSLPGLKIDTSENVLIDIPLDVPQEIPVSDSQPLVPTAKVSCTSRLFQPSPIETLTPVQKRERLKLSICRLSKSCFSGGDEQLLDLATELNEDPRSAIPLAITDRACHLIYRHSYALRFALYAITPLICITGGTRLIDPTHFSALSNSLFSGYLLLHSVNHGTKIQRLEKLSALTQQYLQSFPDNQHRHIARSARSVRTSA
jgi:hypothetical protein